MDDIHLPAPECITDLYSLFAWVMLKNSHKFFGCYGLSQAYIYDMDITLNLFSEQFSSCDPYFSIQYFKDSNPLWYKNIHKYEQKPSKKRDC